MSGTLYLNRVLTEKNKHHSKTKISFASVCNNLKLRKYNEFYLVNCIFYNCFFSEYKNDYCKLLSLNHFNYFYALLLQVTKKVNPLRCKIFVGGLTSEMTEQDVRNYFVQFGQISEYQQPFDKMKNQKKGFCFITFEDSEVVNQVLKNPKQVINGKEVDVKKVKFNPETMTAPGTRVGPVGTRAPATFGMRPTYPGYMAPAAASPYGTAADYGYAANAYDAYGAYGGYDYSAIGYGGGGYSAQAYGGGKYRETTYPRHAPY